MKRLIAVRRRYKAFGRGDLRLIDSSNVRILAFVRTWEEQCVLVVANLSRFVQHVELDLSAFEGMLPVEAFGRTSFPAVRQASYPLTLGPHAFLWLELTPALAPAGARPLPHLHVDRSWEELLTGQSRADLEAVLPAYIARPSTWNLASRTVLTVHMEQATPIGSGVRRRWLTLLRVAFARGEPERYLLPLGCRPATSRRRRAATDAIGTLATRRSPGRRFELYDAAEDPGLAAALVERVSMPDGAPAGAGDIRAVRPGHGGVLPLRSDAPRRLRRPRRGSNALVVFGRRGVLKFFRQVEPGPSPEVEMYARLHEAGFRHTPALLAAFEWELGEHGSAWVGILQQYVGNQGEAWQHAVEAARRFLDRSGRKSRAPSMVRSLLPEAVPPGNGPEEMARLLGSYFHVIEQLGRRTADLHRALSNPTSDPAFAPEPFSSFSRRSAYQRMRSLALTVLQALSELPSREPALGRLVQQCERQRAGVLTVFQRLLERPVTTMRIRCHGNLHLGQFLHAGGELAIIDFEGEPGRPVYERRLKHSPLHDVAAMVRSFHYAGHAALRPDGRPPDGRTMRWLRIWQQHATTAFVSAYVRSLAGTHLLPDDADDARVLLHAYLVERLMYEIGYELNRDSESLRGALLDLPLLVWNGESPAGTLTGRSE